MFKKYGIGIMVSMFIFTGVFFYVSQSEEPASERETIKSLYCEDSVWKKIQAGEVYLQSFSNTEQWIDRLELKIKRLKKKENAVLSMQVLDENSDVIYSYEPKIADFESDEVPIVFFFEDEHREKMKHGKKFSFKLEVLNATEGGLVAIPVVPQSYRTDADTWIAELSINGQKIEDVLVPLKLYVTKYVKDDTIQWYAAAFFVVLIILVCNAYVVKHWENLRLIYDQYSRLAMVSVMLLLFLTFLCVYRILIDVILVVLLLVSSYCIGSLLLKEQTCKANHSYICIGTGFCVLGVMIYYILAAGIGSKEIYFLLLAVPVLFQRRKLMKKGKNLYHRVRRLNWVYGFCAFGLLMFYLAMAAAPIDNADAMTKHLPISIYAADLGTWYDNIIEDIVVYSESTLLPYTYSVLCTSFGCVKAFQILNMSLFFLICGMLFRWGKMLYNQWNHRCSVLFFVVFFSTPYLLFLSTQYMVDLIAIYIGMNLLLCVSENEISVTYRLPFLAFFAGCMVFTKLTILSAALCLGIVTAVQVAGYLTAVKDMIDTNKKRKAFIKSLLRSILLFFLPFLFSFCKNWYMTGNPFSITAYNDLFQSPYFSTDFVRPFQNSGIADGFMSYFHIVFHTNAMVEARNGAMGWFLLLAYIVPFAVLITKNRKLFFWMMIMFAMLLLGGKISGNLRYNLFPLLCTEVMIVISIDLLCSSLKRRKGTIIFSLLVIFTFVWNAGFVCNQYHPKKRCSLNSQITACPNQDILKNVPKGSRVFAFNDDLKGDFNGFYFVSNFHNDYSLHRIKNGERDIKDFLLGFDYALYRKNVSLEGMPRYLRLEYKRLKQDNDIWNIEFEDQKYILYKINKYKKEEIIYKEDESREIEQKEQQKIELNPWYDAYKLHLTISCQSGLELPIPSIAADFVFFDAEGKVVQWETTENKVYPKEFGMDTGWIEKSFPIRDGSVSKVIVYLKNTDNTKCQASNIVVKGIKYDNMLDEMIEGYYNRQALQ